MGCILAFRVSLVGLYQGLARVHEAECTPPYADGAGSCVPSRAGRRDDAIQAGDDFDGAVARPSGKCRYADAEVVG